VTLPRGGPEPGRIDQFDGLRALAFGAVFLHHAVSAPLLWMGVDLFFVLSGYLITRNLLRLRETATTGGALRVFYFRRLLRIVPPYYLAVFAMALYVPAYRDHLGWYLGFASNLRDTLVGPDPGPATTLWSIAVEEQFYLLWPMLVLLCPRR
jgi:peptidoglycan/LPS O-acetylase OafA/YrhL